MKFTVLGATGFIGRHLVNYLRGLGHECFAPTRDDQSIFEQPLGHVIYCIGLTADFRSRPYDTARAHVGVLTEVLEKCRFESLLYLSSTRVYGNSATATESAVLCADPQNPSDLYNLTKLTGEALCFATGRPTVRVARLSNVYGCNMDSENFLASVIRDALQQRSVTVQTSPNSEKDYVYVDDVVQVLTKIALNGKKPLYNVASGVNTNNYDLMRDIQALTGCNVIFADNAPTVTFPPVSIELLKSEFGFLSQSTHKTLELVVSEFKR